jgi:hypothetical protein
MKEASLRHRIAVPCAAWVCTVGLVLGSSAGAQTPPATSTASAGTANPAAVTPAPPAKPGAAAAAPAGKPVRMLPDRFAGRAGMYYKSVWGVDLLTVRRMESGELIRFAWRVLDPEKAKALHDKQAVPSLEDPQAGVSLVVPQLENIGMLRQSQTPEAGRTYWMSFSNKGRLVKPGDHVNVVVGPFRANGLVVD